jgi:hypothetical protein
MWHLDAGLDLHPFQFTPTCTIYLGRKIGRNPRRIPN